MIKGTRTVNGKTPFEQKWGISANELAEQEGVGTPAIHMRVNLYGTPFQRKAKPTNIERKYGATIFELGKQLNLHPISVVQRELWFGDVYRESDRPSHNRGKSLKPEEEKKWRKHYKDVFWLHENHPDYDRARQGNWGDDDA